MSISSLATETLSEILHLSVEYDEMRVDSMTEGPVVDINYPDASWLNTTLFAVSVVCREWRDVSFGLRVWRNIVVDHDARAGRGTSSAKDFLRTLLNRAIANGRRLDVKLEIWTREPIVALQSCALRRLEASEVAWRSFSFVSHWSNSLDVLFDFLERNQQRMVGWEGFSVGLSDAGETALPKEMTKELLEIVDGMNQIEHLGLSLDCRYRLNGKYEVPKIPSMTLMPSSPLLGLRELDVQGCPSVCVSMLRMCRRLSSATLCLKYPDGGDWVRTVRYGGRWEEAQRVVKAEEIVALKELSHLSLFVNGVDVKHNDLLGYLVCPRLRRFTVEWAMEDGKGVKDVMNFLDKVGAVVGDFWLPDASPAVVKGFEARGLIQLDHPRRYKEYLEM
ncbi:hypothetical protein V5O48_012529 [Marasmius crinis-equi]|uniref:F-box domain-containing protein n=1 Tax=Marasmius crinis-equi TaxID=585013 RepID=A0ABR3F2K9_9AGAR